MRGNVAENQRNRIQTGKLPGVQFISLTSEIYKLTKSFRQSPMPIAPRPSSSMSDTCPMTSKSSPALITSADSAQPWTHQHEFGTSNARLREIQPAPTELSSTQVTQVCDLPKLVKQEEYADCLRLLYY